LTPSNLLDDVAQLAQQGLVVAIDVGEGLEETCLGVGVHGIIYKVHGNGGSDFVVGEETIGARGVSMVAEPLIATLSLRRDVHGDAEAVDGPLVEVGGEEEGEVEGSLYADATMRDGTTGTREGAWGIGVVEIDGETVGEAEHYPAEGVALSASLHEAQLAILHVIG
jgi:hypothetical protein